MWHTSGVPHIIICGIFCIIIYNYTNAITNMWHTSGARGSPNRLWRPKGRLFLRQAPHLRRPSETQWVSWRHGAHSARLRRKQPQMHPFGSSDRRPICGAHRVAHLRLNGGRGGAAAARPIEPFGSMGQIGLRRKQPTHSARLGRQQPQTRRPFGAATPTRRRPSRRRSGKPPTLRATPDSPRRGGSGIEPPETPPLPRGGGKSRRAGPRAAGPPRSRAARTGFLRRPVSAPVPDAETPLSAPAPPRRGSRRRAGIARNRPSGKISSAGRMHRRSSRRGNPPLPHSHASRAKTVDRTKFFFVVRKSSIPAQRPRARGGRAKRKRSL